MLKKLLEKREKDFLKKIIKCIIKKILLKNHYYIMEENLILEYGFYL